MSWNLKLKKTVRLDSKKNVLSLAVFCFGIADLIKFVFLGGVLFFGIADLIKRAQTKTTCGLVIMVGHGGRWQWSWHDDGRVVMLVMVVMVWWCGGVGMWSWFWL